MKHIHSLFQNLACNTRQAASPANRSVRSAHNGDKGFVLLGLIVVWAVLAAATVLTWH